MKEIVDQKKKKTGEVRWKKKKKKNKTHRTVEETLVLAADNLIIHGLKLSKIK